MNNFVSWEYYNSHFPNLSEEEFSKNVYQASIIVKRKLNKKFNEMNDEEKIMVQDCVCMLLNSNLYQTNMLSSVSNDGYSESYNTNESEKRKNKMINEMLGHLVKHYECF